MDNRWDKKKDDILKANKRRGNVSFADVESIFGYPYYEDSINDDPQQMRAIGWVNAKLYTLIFEYREDESGNTCRYLVTFWPSTKNERRLYASFL